MIIPAHADLAGRYRVTNGSRFHLKDIDLATGTFLPLGQGDLDLEDVVRAVVEAGYDSWLVVELDHTDGAPADAAAVSHAYLTDLLSRATY